MSYYGISVFITIAVTSLIAFYLLYKAKELNLGVMLSISLGAVILGFSFRPAFNAILDLLRDKMSINSKLALLLALFLILLVFLVCILVICLIISIFIPAKFTKIDCGIVIDKIIESIKKSFPAFAGKINPQIKNIVKNVYNIRNKLKKPVDTKQIIDTMGIEKNEIAETQSRIAENEELSELLEVAGLQAAGLQAAELHAAAGETEVLEVFRTAPPEEILKSPVREEEVPPVPVNNGNLPGYDTYRGEDTVHGEEDGPGTDAMDEAFEYADAVEFRIIAGDAALDEGGQAGAPEDIYNNLVFEVSDIVDQVIDESSAVTARSLVTRAFESKDGGRMEEAVGYYMEALEHEPEKEMVFWIVLDVCALYKQLGLDELAKSILEGIIGQYGSIIQPDVKAEIMKNLK